MADVFDKAKRSEVMARIRSKGNKHTELALLKLLRSHKIAGWRRNEVVLGKPDFVFRRGQVAVFVDGCFWHGCPKHYQVPASNRTFWKQKFGTNKERDRYVTRTLKRGGWTVVRIWECQLAKVPDRCVSRIRRALNGEE